MAIPLFDRAGRELERPVPRRRMEVETGPGQGVTPTPPGPAAPPPPEPPTGGAPRPSWQPENPDEGELPLPPAPPGPPLGEATNSPLALPSSFAVPGTPAAAPFRSTSFLSNRVVGPSRTGPGAALVGGVGGFSELNEAEHQGRPDTDDELVRRIVLGLAQRRR